MQKFHRANASTAAEPRTVRFLEKGPQIPLELVRARDAGEVVFVVGAGASRGSGLSSFKALTSAVFLELTGANPSDPTGTPHAEHSAYCAGAYDVALGILEERLDGGPLPAQSPSRRVREAVARELCADKASSLNQHRDLLVLSQDPSGRARLVTTNFDTLFERAWPLACGSRVPVRSRAGGDLPGPGSPDFWGVLHLHGRLADPRSTPVMEETDLILTGADFGDAYLRSGWAARFLYDLVRRYHIVLVGYGAEDPPLKYLLNVISADRRRFRDLRTIYAFDSAGTDGAQVTQAWLAKGIRPLLYEDDPAHANLYGSLAEWAAWVADPQGWAERRLREVVGRSYTEASSAERGVLELLLTSPANCRLLKKLGGDFSWIRAIEDARPGWERGSGGDSSIEPQMGTYLSSLKAWLLDELETPAAMAWAVDRLTPRQRSPNDAAEGLEAKDEAVRSTRVAGFSSEEISVLDDLIERQSKDWNPASRRFWSLLSRAVRDVGRGRSDVFAYDLVERLKSSEAPDLSEIDRLARFLQPQLRLERPWQWATGGGDEEATGSFDPQSLTTRSIHWGGYPDHREIVAALPDNPSWLALLLRALEAELDAAYRLAILMGWMEEGSDLLHRLTNRVATETH